MEVPKHTKSRPGYIVCPKCESGGLQLKPYTFTLAECSFCSQAFERAVFKTLKQIAALQEIVGTHACEECLHPEMHRMAGGGFLCPACHSEVLPVNLPELSHDEPNEGQISEFVDKYWKELNMPPT